jgi:hypothetical protein
VGALLTEVILQRNVPAVREACGMMDPNVCAICGQVGTWACLDVPVCYKHCGVEFAGERKRLKEQRGEQDEVFEHTVGTGRADGKG